MQHACRYRRNVEVAFSSVEKVTCPVPVPRRGPHRKKRDGDLGSAGAGRSGPTHGSLLATPWLTAVGGAIDSLAKRSIPPRHHDSVALWPWAGRRAKNTRFLGRGARGAMNEVRGGSLVDLKANEERHLERHCLRS